MKIFCRSTPSLAVFVAFSAPLSVCPMDNQVLIEDIDSQEEVAGSELGISNSDIQPDPNASPNYVYNRYQQVEEFESKSNKIVLNSTTTAMFEDAFNRAPADAKNIVAHLKDPSLFNKPQYRSAFFVGAPGVGKTTLAKAIAYKLMPDWDARFIICAMLRGEGRGKTSMNLWKELSSAVSDGKKRLIIIDEINRLLDNHESKNYDTAENADTLWNFLDSQEEQGNHNFFLIGTMNQADKLPEQIKSRISARCIELLQLTRFETKKRSFLNAVLDSSTQLHAECDDVYLRQVLKKCKEWSDRDYSELSIKMISAYINAGGTGPVKIIKKEHIDAGLKAIAQTRKKVLKVGVQPETDEQRQNRFHNENMERSEDQFRRQQLIQLTINENQQSVYRPSLSVGPIPAVTVASVRQELTPEGRQEVMNILNAARPVQQAAASTGQNRPQEQAQENRGIEIPLLPVIGLLVAPQITIPILVFSLLFS